MQIRQPSPELIREASPEPIREPSPEAIREPSPVREASPVQSREQAREPSPLNKPKAREASPVREQDTASLDSSPVIVPAAKKESFDMVPEFASEANMLLSDSSTDDPPEKQTYKQNVGSLDPFSVGGTNGNNDDMDDGVSCNAGYGDDDEQEDLGLWAAAEEKQQLKRRNDSLRTTNLELYEDWLRSLEATQIAVKNMQSYQRKAATLAERVKELEAELKGKSIDISDQSIGHVFHDGKPSVHKKVTLQAADIAKLEYMDEPAEEVAANVCE